MHRHKEPLTLPETIHTQEETLVQMNKVTVSWSEHVVLDNLSWTLRKGEHWLIRGPNGSGKTTFLELITGDNPQVFCKRCMAIRKKTRNGRNDLGTQGKNGDRLVPTPRRVPGARGDSRSKPSFCRDYTTPSAFISNAVRTGTGSREKMAFRWRGLQEGRTNNSKICRMESNGPF